MRITTASQIILLSLGFVHASTAGAQEQSPFDTARQTLEKWVETRQLISQERTEWQAQKQTLQDSIRLLSEELVTHEENIARAEDETTAADIEREKLMEENEVFRAAASSVARAMGGLEARIRTLVARLPDDLVNKEGIQTLINRIPRDPASTRMSLSERMLNIVGILSEAEKFNNAITLANELRTLPSGETVQVRTMYVGLGHGYYVDGAGQFAGILIPEADGWTDHSRNELAPAIQDVIAYYEKTKQPPRFVNIPVEIR